MIGQNWPIRTALELAISSGVPANTLVLLLLLPLVASLIAAARHIVGIRGFGIFLPAALAVVFVAIGPFIGIALFLVIVAGSTLARIILKSLKSKLQYLPRMALILWFVVISVLTVFFSAAYFGNIDISKVSIFPLLILVLLAEDFTRVQIGKSAKTAISLATETIILSFFSYLFLTFIPLQNFALDNPEVFLLSIALINILLGKYTGLRIIEFWRFRKLFKG